MAVTPPKTRSSEKISFIRYLYQRRLISEPMYEDNRRIASDIDLVAKTINLNTNLVSIYHEEWSACDFTALVDDIDDDILSFLPSALCRKYEIIPYHLEHNILTLACCDPNNVTMRREVTALYRNCKFNLADSIVIEALLHVYYRNVQAVLDVSEILANESAYAIGASDMLDRLIDEIVIDGYDYDATDIHIVSTSASLTYRLRTHHQFFPRVILPKSISLQFKNRLLIRAGCAFNKLKHVQDAAIKVESERAVIPIRVSYIPTQDGYSVVLRIIREQYTNLDKSLLNDKQWSNLLFELQYNKGLILVSGPVGSGKTTFYYGIMRRLAANRLKIISIEDPIESRIPHAFQMDISQENLTFQETMKIILRQDPDVLMVGEIRANDAVTCVSEAKLSGNMVIGTIHAQTPWDCVIKLRKLGYPENQLVSQGLCILMTRLIPYLCPHCRTEHELSAQELQMLSDFTEIKEIKKWYRSPGCKHCHYSGVETIKPFYDILSISPQKLSELSKDWDGMRFDEYLQLPVNNLRTHLLDMARNGTADLQTYFELTSL